MRYNCCVTFDKHYFLSDRVTLPNQLGDSSDHFKMAVYSGDYLEIKLSHREKPNNKWDQSFCFVLFCFDGIVAVKKKKNQYS